MQLNPRKNHYHLSTTMYSLELKLKNLDCSCTENMGANKVGHLLSPCTRDCFEPNIKEPIKAPKEDCLSWLDYYWIIAIPVWRYPMIINHNFSVARPTHARTPGPLLTSRSRPGLMHLLWHGSTSSISAWKWREISAFINHTSSLSPTIKWEQAYERSLNPSFVFLFGQKLSQFN